ITAEVMMAQLQIYFITTVLCCWINDSDVCRHPSRNHPWISVSNHHQSIERTARNELVSRNKERISTNQSGQWQAISKSIHGCLEIAGLKVLIDGLAFHSSIHVRPDQWDGAPWNPSTFIGYLNGDILLTFYDDDFDGREAIFVVMTVPFDDCSE